jgi:hypothetical protein
MDMSTRIIGYQWNQKVCRKPCGKWFAATSENAAACGRSVVGFAGRVNTSFPSSSSRVGIGLRSTQGGKRLVIHCGMNEPGAASVAVCMVGGNDLKIISMLTPSTSRRRLVASRGHAANYLDQTNKTCIPRWRHQSGCPILPFPATHDTALTKCL